MLTRQFKLCAAGLSIVVASCQTLSNDYSPLPANSGPAEFFRMWRERCGLLTESSFRAYLRVQETKEIALQGEWNSDRTQLSTQGITPMGGTAFDMQFSNGILVVTPQIPEVHALTKPLSEMGSANLHGFICRANLNEQSELFFRKSDSNELQPTQTQFFAKSILNFSSTTVEVQSDIELRPEGETTFVTVSSRYFAGFLHSSEVAKSVWKGSLAKDADGKWRVVPDEIEMDGQNSRVQLKFEDFE